MIDAINGSQENHIDTDTSHDVFLSIRALDKGISNHEHWISQLHQSLICKNVHPNTDDLCDDAHCRCKFGLWLYSPETAVLQKNTFFRAVVENHQKMHAQARSILQKNEHGEDINENEYCDFTADAIAFKLDVRNLQYNLMTQVCEIDHLTGVWNRYAMQSKLNQEQERMFRSGTSSTICMMDIDFFKSINDNYGHQVGDQVLKTVIGFCSDSLRKYDSIFRYGGEEFLFFLPETDTEEACLIVERLCENLASHPIMLENSESINITASFGIASMNKFDTVENTIQSADHALLYAKSQGRNRVCCWHKGLKKNEQ